MYCASYRIHAADVLRTLYVIMTQGGVLKAAWPEHQELGLLLAILSAVMHDFQHRGLNVSWGGSMVALQSVLIMNVNHGLLLAILSAVMHNF